MRRRVEGLAPLLLLAVLCAAAFYRITEDGAAAPVPPTAQQTAPLLQTAEPEKRGVAVRRFALPPPPPPRTASAQTERRMQPRPALLPSQTAPAVVAKDRAALRPTPNPRPPASSPRAIRVAALQPAKPPAGSTVQARPALDPAARSVSSSTPSPTQTHVSVSTGPDRGPPESSPSVQDRAAVEQAGRSLLRVLEHGQGPAIEIAWPDAPSARADLYRRLVACYGMQVALLDRAGRLFASSGAAGVPWEIDLDRHSGFVRQAEGRITAEEQQVAGRIAARHGLAPSASVVRVFPRGVDASLLGGLHALLGGDYRDVAVIRGRYGLAGDRLLVAKITADGQALDRPVVLRTTGAGRCP